MTGVENDLEGFVGVFTGGTEVKTEEVRPVTRFLHLVQRRERANLKTSER